MKVSLRRSYLIFNLIYDPDNVFSRRTPGWETEYTIGQLERLIKSCGLQIVSTYGDWSHPNIFLKALMIMLKILRKSPNINLSQDSGSLVAKFKKTRIAYYTFQHIGVIGKK